MQINARPSHPFIVTIIEALENNPEGLSEFWTRLQRRDQRAAALAELGLSDPVDDETIKKTYRHLAMEHHPDRGGDKERLQAINRAVGVL